MKETPFVRAQVYSHEPSLYYEKPDIFLATLVGPRMGTKGLFPENEVIKLMRNIVDALAFLESRGIRYGDVHDVNIYYDKLSKVFKLLNPHNIQATGYDLTHRGQRFSFLSPELLLALSEEKNAVDLNVLQKSDLFALGILLIEVCTLKSSSELYDPETYNILDGAIQDRLALIGNQYYSKKVLRPISLMIEYDMDRRPTPMELKALLDNENRLPPSQPQPQSQPPTPHLNMMGSVLPEMVSPSKQKINPFQQIFDEEQARHPAY